MKFLTIFLQAEGAPAQGGGSWSILVMFARMFVVMWLFMIRPQQKKQKEMEKFRNELKKGDKVVTIGGIRGTVAIVKESTVIIKVDDNTRIEFSKSAISAVLNKKEESASEKPAKKEKEEKIEKVEKPAVEAPAAEEKPAEEPAAEEKAEN